MSAKRGDDDSVASGKQKSEVTEIPFGSHDFVYGLCVDVCHRQECWRKGVVFDHNDEADKRLIFFPDQGDKLLADISRLRISQNWVEECGTWQPSGNWYFLQLIDAYSKHCPIPVSVEQLWYDLQETEGFKQIKEWNSGDQRPLWEELVLDTICENLAIALRSKILQKLEDKRMVGKTPADVHRI